MTLSYRINLQYVNVDNVPIRKEIILSWIKYILRFNMIHKAEITIRFVNIQEIKKLNFYYRKKNYSTNVLSFPCNISKIIPCKYPILGDIVICPHILQKESILFNQLIEKYWALIIIHGILHLLGYDHITYKDYKLMRMLEKKILFYLGFC